VHDLESDTRAATSDDMTLHRYALDAVRDIVLVVSEDGSLRDANLSAEQAYGYPRDVLLSLGIADLRAPESRSEVAEQYRRALEHGITFETVHVRKDGSTFPVEVSSSPLRYGGMGGVISVVRDITRR